MNILLIEDNPADIYLLQEEFAAIEGEHVLYVAKSVAEALESISQSRPDAVLLDLSLPDGNGLETLTTIQQAGLDLPILILSGNADQTMAIEAVRRGAQDYVLKGRMDPDGLLRALRYAVERAAVKARLRASEARYRRLFDSVPVGVFQARVGGALIAANATMVEMLGFGNEADLIRASAAGSLYLNNGQLKTAAIELEKTGMLDGFESELFHRSGKTLTMLVSAVAVVDPLNKEITVEGTLVDITERKQAERLLKEQAEVDELTQLMNRRAFRAVMTTALHAAVTQYPTVAPALLMFDLDGFKAVNDTLGHAAGDELLRQVAARVTRVLRTGDNLARLGGDEFVVLCNVLERTHLARIADKVGGELARPFTIDGQTVRIGGSIGISMYLHNGTSVDDLLSTADVAMYCAKHAGKGRFAFADSGLETDVA
ncbi:MAG: diguanylate cyclase [Woeseia sp.]